MPLSNQLSSSGPTVYIPPSTMPRERPETEDSPLPPPVRYFRMGGGDGHKTSQGNMFHGGLWMQSTSWPPPGTKMQSFFLGRRRLDRSSPAPPVRREHSEGGEHGRIGEHHNRQPQGEAPSQPHWHSVFPPPTMISSLDDCTTFPFDPRNPCPSIGGNLFTHSNILLSGAYNQVERKDMFLCSPPFLPLSSRRDVCVFRTDVLTSPLDVTGMPIAHLYISSTAVDTDFTVKLIDEYPASLDYPQGFAMQITHGIKRVRYRESREQSRLMTPGKVYRITVEMYPTSNLFNVGHRLRLDVSSSNFPHFDINMNTADPFESKRYVIAENSVYHNKQFPSTLELPIQTKSVVGYGAMDEVWLAKQMGLQRKAKLWVSNQPNNPTTFRW